MEGTMRLSAFPLLAVATLVAVPAASETLYFKNQRTLEVSSYKLKGALLYAKLPSGRTVYVRADSVDWEGTARIQAGGINLVPGSWDAVQYSATGGALAPARTMTASDLRKGGAGRLRRSGAPAIVIDIRGDAGWVDTSINVHSGQHLLIRASGEVEVAPGLPSGPNGVSGGSGSLLFDGAGRGALLGRIGTGGTVMVIGAGQDMVANATGRLFLAVNDGGSSDNTGAYSVRFEMAGEMAAHSAPGFSTAAPLGRAPMSAPAAGAPSAAPPPSQPRNTGMQGGVDRAKAARGAAESRPNPLAP
jgi:hypothetical protein